MSELEGRVIAITGASSGIGRALARECAKRGADLSLSDVDEAGLRKTADSIAARKVTTKVVDVSDRAAVEAWAAETIEAHGRCDGVVNNAGVSLSDTLVDCDYEDLEWIFGINFWGVVHGTKAFLPHFLERDTGWVVNVSSIFGIVSFPTQSAYNATKFAVRGLTESLRQEVAGTGVHVVSVHPGGIKTNIVRNGRYRQGADGGDRDEAIASFDKIARTSPETAAIVIADAMEAHEPRALIGADAKFLETVQRLFPGNYERILEPLTTLLRR